MSQKQYSADEAYKLLCLDSELSDKADSDVSFCGFEESDTESSDSSVHAGRLSKRCRTTKPQNSDTPNTSRDVTTTSAPSSDTSSTSRDVTTTSAPSSDTPSTSRDVLTTSSPSSDTPSTSRDVLTTSSPSSDTPSTRRDVTTTSAPSSDTPSTSRVIPTSSREAQVPETLPQIASLNWQPPSTGIPFVPEFNAVPGITQDVTGNDPLQFFQLFLPDNLFELFAKETNLYGAQYISNNPSSYYARPGQWTPTNVEEMKIFLALTFAMGIIKKTTIPSNWEASPIHSTPSFATVMSRQRYEILLKFFHFNDNSQCPSNSSPDYDWLYKIRPLLNYLSEKCLTVYTPSENVSVDESLVKFKRRLHFKQFLPSKWARYGIKLYKLCESTTGHTSAFQVYQGRDNKLNPQGCPAGFGINAKVVWELMGPLLQKGYKLFIDNYYTSIPLFQSLQEANMGACGTFRRNRRGFPQSLLAKKLQRGQSDALYSGNLLALRYKDRKDVLMLSTIHTEATVPIRERGSTTNIQKPTCILEYNKYMGGTDLYDQVLKPYEVMCKSYVWYKKLSIYLLQMAMYNSYVLYKKSGGTQTFLCYQEIVIEK
ncbi:piggyBac transposable element-derived protein 4-like [Bufo bufo]|uniref:piggyBac transposable element-derived protein 4-like n=1 Tax=Bufo bufo TaxID=8384 RepID=UPI001ABEE5C2|nr:piggyBac transposable element-derived protein 4-like [Bufo bufo]